MLHAYSVNLQYMDKIWYGISDGHVPNLLCTIVTTVFRMQLYTDNWSIPYTRNNKLLSFPNTPAVQPYRHAYTV